MVGALTGLCLGAVPIRVVTSRRPCQEERSPTANIAQPERRRVPSSTDSARVPAGSRRIVIVVGPGRSGTSTVAGTLERLGLHVPEPVIGPNETNPSGFFEPRWVVDFHRELLDRAVVHTLDASTAAQERADKVGARPAVRRRLEKWLAGKLEEAPQLIVKDPRTIWFADLWVDTARSLGVEPGFITMLRHPAEVSRSRQTYYRDPAQGDATWRSDDIGRIAGWVNVALNAERVTRSSDRVFVRYTDLVGDWRSAMRRVGTSLDLSFQPAVDVSPHPADSFIDPSLHRVHIEWDNVDVPEPLRHVGEGVWRTLTGLAGDDAGNEKALKEIDSLREQYSLLEADALALGKQSVWRARIEGRRNGRKTAVAEARAAAEQEQQAAASQAAAAPDRPGPTGAGRWRRMLRRPASRSRA